MIALRYMGEGEFQTSSAALAAKCDRELVIGEVLRWDQVSDRSMKSHDHYFACIDDAWGNLPADLADELPSPEHLRKYALIKCGYCTIIKWVCRTNADAVASCAFISAIDTYAICEIIDRVVTVYRAESQSKQAMGRWDFAESKDRVLTFISGLIGADVATHAGQSA